MQICDLLLFIFNTTVVQDVLLFSIKCYNWRT